MGNRFRKENCCNWGWLNPESFCATIPYCKSLVHWRAYAARLKQNSENVSREEISTPPSMGGLLFKACLFQRTTPETTTDERYNRREPGYGPLLNAALRGDWKAGKKFLSDQLTAVCAEITGEKETALHIAAVAGHREFVEELVKMMMPRDLEMRNKHGNTALCLAAASGVTEIAKAMVDKNPGLPLIRGSNEATPLYIAAQLGKEDMVQYLLSATNINELTHSERINIFFAAIDSKLFDVALTLIDQHPELAMSDINNGETALHVLARMPSAFSSGSQLLIRLRRFFSSGTKETCDPNSVTMLADKLLELMRTRGDEELPALSDEELLTELSPLLFTAAESGNSGFLTVLIRLHPQLLWEANDQNRSIIHVAVEHRHEKIFRLIHDKRARKDMIAAYKDGDHNNMLHLAGKLAPRIQLKIDSGAALQMQEELLWFKEVEVIVQPSYREMKNSEGKTPYLLFTEEHKELRQEAEKWMKHTASSCMIVATLICTMAFSATFTIPGGNDDDTGKPIFLHNRLFMIFTVSTALAVFSSATSVLMFLSILTSRYAEEDFLYSLPSRLVLGLGSLFVSIAALMVAFGATHFIFLGHDYARIAIPIAAFASGTVTLFALLQFPLLSDMIRHICSCSSLIQKTAHCSDH